MSHQIVRNKFSDATCRADRPEIVPQREDFALLLALMSVSLQALLVLVLPNLLSTFLKVVSHILKSKRQ